MKLTGRASLLAGVVALAGVAHTPQASASVYNLGTLPVPTSVGFSGRLAVQGAFSDWWNFKLASDSALVGASSSITFSQGAAAVGTKLTNFDLYSGTNLLASGTPLWFATGVGVVSYFSVVYALPLTAGVQYSLKVSGTALNANASYGASLSTAPLPEPEEWAMMAVGAALVGAQVRRKQRGMRQPSGG